MSDTTTAEILLKVNTELRDLTKLTAGFGDLKGEIAKVGAEIRTLGTTIQGSWNDGIRKVQASMRLMSLESSRAAAEQRNVASSAQQVGVAERQVAVDAKRVTDETRRTKRELEQTRVAAVSFGAALKTAFVTVGGLTLISTAKNAITTLFRDAVGGGVRFNATLEAAQLSVASVLRTFKPAEYQNFNQAINASRNIIDRLREKALETSATFESLVEAYTGSAGALTNAGVPLGKQVDLLVTVSQAMAALGINVWEAWQEITALLEGRIDRNARLGTNLAAVGVNTQSI